MQLYGSSSKQKRSRSVEEEVTQQTKNQDTNEGNKETNEKFTADSSDSINTTFKTTKGSEKWLDASRTSSIEKRAKTMARRLQNQREQELIEKNQTEKKK
ncbi:hypothetical protein CHS0354_034293 [Potamilus streckersoni]|uniref:Uncharacterized protein n=1 Tax=Potamilus streckersoni TaxID=2493646 RepID=A0AAE0TB05_9BIVA|nr:hypothetical protein CHS0354_034293 [Potamilus streckersoni]